MARGWLERRATRRMHEERLAEEAAPAEGGGDAAAEPIADALPAWLRGRLLPVAEWYAGRLERAGYAGRAAVERFLAAKGAALAVGVALIILVLVKRPLAPIAAPWCDWLLVAVVSIAATLGPDGVLARLGRVRGDSISRDLPFVLDLLVVLVEAGVAFDGALARFVAETEREPHRYELPPDGSRQPPVPHGTGPSPIEEELGRLRAEIEHGTPRAQAFRALAVRAGAEELETVVAAIVQIESMGGSIAPTLRAQADGLRARRFESARERAQKLPVLLVFPLFLCIFPSLFIVTLGPSLIRVIDLLGSMPKR